LLSAFVSFGLFGLHGEKQLTYAPNEECCMPDNEDCCKTKSDKEQKACCNPEDLE
jgi:hypothetical protein